MPSRSTGKIVARGIKNAQEGEPPPSLVNQVKTYVEHAGRVVNWHVMQTDYARRNTQKRLIIALKFLNKNNLLDE